MEVVIEPNEKDELGVTPIEVEQNQEKPRKRYVHGSDEDDNWTPDLGWTEKRKKKKRRQSKMRQRSFRAQLSEEDRLARNEKERLRKSKARANETEEERRARLERGRLKTQRARALETPEQKAARRERDKIRKYMARANETQEERKKRLEKENFRKILNRANKRESSEGQIVNCYMCDESFGSRTYLLQHVTQIHTEIRCEHCDEVFLELSAFEEHVRSLMPQRYSCQTCGQNFKTKAKIRRHIEIEHEGFEPRKRPDDHSRIDPKSGMIRERNACSDCGRDYATPQALQKHIKIFHLGIREFKCDQCDMTFTAKSNLRGHTLSIHHGIFEFQCTQCDYKCAYKNNLQTHMKNAHEKPIVKSNSKVKKCDLCNEEFKIKYEFKAHIFKAHVKMKCNTCGEFFNGSAALKAHVVNCEKSLQIQAESETKLVDQDLGGNSEMNYAESEEVKPIKSELNESMDDYQQYDDSFNYSNEYLETDENLNISCDVCQDQTFSSLSDLKSHILEFHNDHFNTYNAGIDINPAETCKTELKYVEHDDQDVKFDANNHDNIPLPPEFTPIVLIPKLEDQPDIKIKTEIVEDMETSYVDDYPLEGEAIDNDDNFDENDNNHELSETSTPKKDSRVRIRLNINLKCPECDKDIHIRSMKRHLINVHKLDANEVDEKYKQAEYGSPLIPSQGKSGQDDNNRQCEVCNKEFKTKKSLKRHRIMIHRIGFEENSSNGVLDDTTNSNAESPNKLENGLPGPFKKCDECDKMFTNIKKLKVHQVKVHGEASDLQGNNLPFSNEEQLDIFKMDGRCHECGKLFKDKRHLARHIKSVHQKIKRFFCDQCDFAAFENGKLNAHKRRVHERVHIYKPPKKCPYCEKMVHHNSLKRHIEVIHQVIEKFSCKECDYTTYYERELKLHVDLKHPVDHQCHICGTIVDKNESMKDHIREFHSKRKTLKNAQDAKECIHCGKMIHVRSLKRHIETIHKVSVEDGRKLRKSPAPTPLAHLDRDQPNNIISHHIFSALTQSSSLL